MNFFPRIATGLLAAGSLLAGAAAVGAQENPSANSLAQLGACIAEKGALDVVLLLDESGSLQYAVRDGQSHPEEPGADAEGHRVDAAQSFIDELLTRQQDTQLQTNVRIAGFGQDYKSGATDPDNYGPWQALDASTAGDVKAEIARFAERTDEDYTNYTNALSGAYQDLIRSGAEDPCRMVVTFTDGELTAAGGGADAAREELCRPGGVTDQLRSAGVSNIGIGLSAPHVPSDFNVFRSLTEGGRTCGTLAPNGAFFEADNVGGLFAAFRSALATGNTASAETRTGEPFEVVLDDSIRNLRFTVIARDDLGPDAYLLLTSPGGETLELRDSGAQNFADANVEWSTMTDPVLKGDGTMTLPEGASWAGPWTLQFAGFDDASVDDRVFSLVEMQPGLQVELHGTGNTGPGGVEVTNEDNLSLQLVDAAGNIHPMQGSATTTVVFHPEGGQPQILSQNLDLSSGVAELPAENIADLPAIGRLETVTTITTQGNPGTTLSSFTNASALSVSLQNLPRVTGGISYRAEAESTSAEIQVTGPGRIWLEPGVTVQAEQLPENIGTITVTSPHNSVDTALQLEAGETAVLPVELSIAELSDGIVNGSLPLQISDLPAAENASVSVPVEATYAVPLNTATFLGALLAALLGALLIPLGILYLIRFLTSTIPRQRFSSLRIPVEERGGQIRYDGQSAFPTHIFDAANPEVSASERGFTAGGVSFQVKSFSLNPLAPTPVLAQASPSLNGADGAHQKGKAKLPLAVQGSWIVVARPQEPNHYDVIVLPRHPLTTEEQEQLQQEITQKLPDRISQLKTMVPAQPAAPADPGPAGGAAFGSGPTQEGSSSPFGPGPTGGNSPFGPGPTGGNSPFNPGPMS
ncbi:MAG TPA: vWA domain-containing protein [Corynebacterium sp.]|nr:vWA domain-containing protein [Corynebacterium sp.]